MRFRPFWELAGAQESSNRFPYHVQRATDFLLTHSFAVEDDHFVVPSDPALLPLLRTLLRLGLNGLWSTTGYAVGIESGPVTTDHFGTEATLAFVCASPVMERQHRLLGRSQM